MNTHWVHSYRMEHAEHFPAPMEMCMDDHHTQTTETTQRQHLQDIGHAEFPPGMESTPVFPGNQFQQGNEEIMDTGTFYIREHYSEQVPSTQHTHTSRDGKFPTRRHFHASTSMLMQPHRWKTSRQRPGADSTPSGKRHTSHIQPSNFNGPNG